MTMHGVSKDGGIGAAGAEEGEDCVWGGGGGEAPDYGQEGPCVGAEGEGHDGRIGVAFAGGLRHGWNVGYM